MQQIDLTNLSKEELMERIKAQRADEIKPIKLLGYLFLVVLIYNIVDYFWGKGSEIKYWAIPALIVLGSFIEVWWKTRMSKCDDAKRMVSLHDNYYKYHKVGHIVVLMIMVPLSYLLFKDYDSIPLGLLVFLAVLWIAAFCWILWRLIKLRKPLCDPKIDRLRELIGK